MTDKTQPEALWLAFDLEQRWNDNMTCAELDAAAELRRLHAENARLSGLCDKWNSECDEFREDNKRLAALVEAQQHTRIAELEAELEAVGAGGVQALSAAPNGWKSVIDEARSGLQDSEPSAFDNSGYRAFAETVLDAVEEGLSALAASPTPQAEQPIGEVVVTKTKDGQIVSVTRQDDEGRILSVIATSDSEGQQAEESRVKLLAECRDAFHIPEPSSPLEVQWAAAMSYPEEVPEYVRMCVAAMQAAPKAAPGELAASATKDAIMGAAYDFRDAHISGSMNLKRSAHAALEAAVDNALAAQAALQQEAQEPALFVSAKQLADLVDPSHATGGSYLPARKTRAGLFTQPLYTAPQPAPAPLSEKDLRTRFEALARDSYNFKRSRSDCYVNPATARDWKWFRLGATVATQGDKP